MLSLSKIREFASRHKKKFIVGGIVVAAGFAVRYAQRKLVEYQEKVEIFNFYFLLGEKNMYFVLISTFCSYIIIFSLLVVINF